jgi:hypothetical protein
MVAAVLCPPPCIGLPELLETRTGLNYVYASSSFVEMGYVTFFCSAAQDPVGAVGLAEGSGPGPALLLCLALMGPECLGGSQWRVEGPHPLLCRQPGTAMASPYSAWDSAGHFQRPAPSCLWGHPLPCQCARGPERTVSAVAAHQAQCHTDEVPVQESSFKIYKHFSLCTFRCGT